MEEPKEKLSAAELTRKYIDRHPSIKDCITKDLVNYSSLSRLIMKETGVKNEEAVLAALSRPGIFGSGDIERTCPIHGCPISDTSIRFLVRAVSRFQAIWMIQNPPATLK